MENKVRFWLAREEKGSLWAYSGVPFKDDDGMWFSDKPQYEIDSSKFPSVKWEDDEPTEAYITLAEPQEQPKQEIDWEQRRYEIAKEMLPVIYRHAMEAQKHGQSVKRKDVADIAVAFADTLIKALKEQSE